MPYKTVNNISGFRNVYAHEWVTKHRKYYETLTFGLTVYGKFNMVWLCLIHSTDGPTKNCILFTCNMKAKYIFIRHHFHIGTKCDKC